MRAPSPRMPSSSQTRRAPTAAMPGAMPMPRALPTTLGLLDGVDELRDEVDVGDVDVARAARSRMASSVAVTRTALMSQ